MDVAPDGTGWALIRESGSTTRLNTINFATGAMNLLGVVGTGTDVYRDLALPAVTNVVQLSAGSYTGSEAAATAKVTVTRSQSLGAASVDYATSNGSATAGSDYTATTGTLTFAAGETSKDVAIPVTNDAAVEGPESLTLTLSNAKGGLASLGGTSSATVAITDDGTVQPPDTTKPAVSTCHKGKQKLVKQKAVLVCVKSNEAGTANATAKLKIKGVKKAVTLKKVSAAVKAGAKRTLKLKLPGKVRKALKKHRSKATATLTIRVRDAAGNERKLTRAIKARK